MDINILIVLIQSIMLIITTVYVVLVYRTLRSNERLNQKRLFNEIVKQERELRINLLKYRDIINDENLKEKRRRESKLDYDTLLFNYYEFLAICLRRNFVNEKDAMLFFEESLKSVKEMFEVSLLFKGGYAKKEDYKGVHWLFKRWRI